MSTLWMRNHAIPSIEQQLTDEINFDIAVEEFANKKARKVTVWKIVVIIWKIKTVLIFYTFLTIFPYMSFLLFVWLLLAMFEFFGEYLKHTIFEHLIVL